MMDNAEPYADAEYVEFPKYCQVTQLQSELANKNERVAVLTQSVDQLDAQKTELLAEVEKWKTKLQQSQATVVELQLRNKALEELSQQLPRALLQRRWTIVSKPKTVPCSIHTKPGYSVNQLPLSSLQISSQAWQTSCNITIGRSMAMASLQMPRVSRGPRRMMARRRRMRGDQGSELSVQRHLK